MNILFRNLLVLLLVGTAFAGNSRPETSPDQRLTRRLRKHLLSWENPLEEWTHVGKIKIDSVSAVSQKKSVQFFFSTPLSYIPVREENCMMLQKSLKDALGRKFREWTMEVFTDNHRLQELIPNSGRKSLAQDVSRISASQKEGRIPLVTRVSSEVPVSGLHKNNIALWCSHGYYYESKLDRWEWQRARLFGTVEEMFTKSITLPFLVPMLENSGATVLLPVERDWQTREVIVDNDHSSEGSALIIPEGVVFTPEKPGFLRKDTLVSGENPFLMGMSLKFNALQEDEKQVTVFPALEEGEYAVYVSYRSYENSSRKVKYTVNNAQGKHDFLVNQRMGGGTWIYLGTFKFHGGDDMVPGSRSVAVSLTGNPGEVISVDAIRFGGGMGNIARRPSDSAIENVKSVNDNQEKTVGSITNPGLFTFKTSGKSRYREAARYYLQYAGFPDTLVYNLNNDKNDYNDDYQSRGEWVNYLMGDPNGPIKNRKAAGLKIPVDLAFAFHTDAGITPDDSIIGTLGIYSTWADKGKFPDGSSRMASRDLTDLIQTQIVEDLRKLFNPEWTRRGLWDRQYSESWRPNVPVMLLELLSHQNLADMKFGHDPRFQFAVGRAIYKGMLKFMAFQEGRKYVVQPLPVDHFALTLMGNGTVKLTWEPVADPLESTASPVKYKVYTQINGNGFDDGQITGESYFVFGSMNSGLGYDFKVTALNDGGESFPSEILSAGIADKSKGTVLVVNAFDRICGPSVFDSGSKSGIEWWNDQGIPWNYNAAYTGTQYDFNRKSEWTDDDNPGWGSSYGDMEDLRIPGNSFDFTGTHGRIITACGYNFVSVSDEVFCRDDFETSRFAATDIILGEEKATLSLKDSSIIDFMVYTPAFMKKIGEITGNGGKILISGAYVGTDFASRKDTVAAKFSKETLHFSWRTGHASKTGKFYSTDYSKKWFDVKGNFNTGNMLDIYAVEAPDGIEPAGKNAFTAFRYGENNVSAGVAFNGKYKCVILGFPVETITETTAQFTLMSQILKFFESD